MREISSAACGTLHEMPYMQACDEDISYRILKLISYSLAEI